MLNFTDKATYNSTWTYTDDKLSLEIKLPTRFFAKVDCLNIEAVSIRVLFNASGDESWAYVCCCT